MQKTELITDQALTHKEWLNLIGFYNDDLRIMENRIAEVNAKNTATEVLAMVDHFQNQIIIQRAHLEDLQRAIVHKQDANTADILKNPIAADHRRTNVDSELHEKMERFRDLFYELRKELLVFLSKTM
jgi:hypothetical protein